MTEHAAICAIIVTYGCGDRIAQVVSAIMPQVGRVIIVDNGSDAATAQAIKRLAGSQVRATFNTNNIGLAAAQNQGIRQALADGFEWILLLDDDSIPADDMVARLLAAWRRQADGRIGIIAPRIVEQNVQAPARYLSPGWKNLGFIRKTVDKGEDWTNAAVVIASGSLIRADVFRAVGMMAGGFFIDYVDYEFCLRARRHGFTILVAGDAALYHRQGGKAVHAVMGMRLITANYAALRRYYIFRNRMFVLRRYGRAFPFLLLHETMAYMWDIGRMLWLEPDTIAKLRGALHGLKDGVTQPVPLEDVVD